MEDTHLCPICYEPFKNIHQNSHFLHEINKFSNFIERNCSNFHSVQLVADKATKTVDLIKISIRSRILNNILYRLL